MNEIPHPGFDKPEEYETFTTTNNLEEAAAKSSTQYYQDAGYSPFPNVETAAHKSGFIAGAKWQKEQDEKELSEKIAAAYQLGIKDKEQKSVEGLDEVAKAYALDTAEDSEQYSARYLGYKDGAEWQKQEMLKEAVEGEVHHYATVHYVITNESQLSARLKQFQDGDKVRIIIVKE